MRQGEVWQIDRFKVLVVSADDLNDAGAYSPVVVPILSTRTADAAAMWAVPTGEMDPVTGAIHLPLLGPPPGAEQGPAKNLGMITGSTLDQVRIGLRELFAH